MLRRTPFAGLLVALLVANFERADAASSNRQTPLVLAIQRVRPAVVNIHSQKTVTQNASFPNAAPLQNRLSGMGTGVIVDERGYIVTNYHVIEDVTSIRVTLVDGATYSAEVVGRDPDTDLALLRINPLTPLKVMPMGTSSDLMHGETVVAIGNAFGYEHTITQGIISELHRDVRLSKEQSYRDLIQTDASINPGNSGGPLINADGEMIGLNVAIRAGAQGIGFAIPVDEVKRVVTRLLSIRTLSKTWHGMNCRNVESSDKDAGRVIVRGVESGSPAQLSGIRAGDRLLAITDRRVESTHDLERFLLDKKPSERIPLTLVREGQQKRVDLVLQLAPEQNGDAGDYVWRRLGIKLVDGPGESDVRTVSTQLRGGMRVAEVQADSVAARAGITAGDILVGLHQWETLTLDNVLYVLNKQSSEQINPLRFFVIRNGQIQRGWLVLSKDD